MHKLHPRSPYQKLGGYVHLPRLIDKAKLHRQGLLNGYNYKTVGFDKHLLAFPATRTRPRKKRASCIFSRKRVAKAAKIFGLISISSSSMKAG